MQSTLVRWLVQAVEQELALHREHLAVLRGAPVGCDAEARVIESVRYAADTRSSLLARVPGADPGWSLLETIDALPLEAQRTAELRGELAELMAGLAFETGRRGERSALDAVPNAA